MTDIGHGSIFEQIIKINNRMTERLKFKVDLQEVNIRDKTGFVVGDQDPAQVAIKEKRLNKQDIKDLIDARMIKVKQIIDDEVMANHRNGEKLQENINSKSDLMKE